MDGSPGDYVKGAHPFFLTQLIIMKRLLEHLGLLPKRTPVRVVAPAKLPELDMKAFNQWCRELNVSAQVNKNTEVSITIGNHVKQVNFDRLHL